ncbi:hypothetical protein [Escherichia coli]|uniref:hypothetical protein n=1 Tax=Escherichia coli TaxID=562 RepID=UPI0010A668EA|nr:hypothetical protein [Escherichia coli]THH50637.1 hypothetical protein FAZ82_09185 [Escherichia coli K-12]
MWQSSAFFVVFSQASPASLRCKKADEVERKQNRIYYRKPRSEMGVTCVGRQKMKLGSKPLI